MARTLRLDAHSAGLLLGATIHDVAQVVAAGHMISDETGLVATYVKLLRVSLLLPVVVTLAWFFSGARGSSRRETVPLFLIAFAVLVALNSAGFIPQSAVGVLSDCSRWCLVIAIAALGINTSLDELAQLGWMPLALVIAETLFLLALVSMGMWMMSG